MVILPRVPDDPDKAQDKRHQKFMGRIFCFIFWNENNAILDQQYPRQSIDNWIYYCYWYYGRNPCINMGPANDCPKGGSTSIHDCFHHNCTCCLSWYIGRDYIYWYLCRILHSKQELALLLQLSSSMLHPRSNHNLHYLFHNWSYCIRVGRLRLRYKRVNSHH